MRGNLELFQLTVESLVFKQFQLCGAVTVITSQQPQKSWRSCPSPPIKSPVWSNRRLRLFRYRSCRGAKEPLTAERLQKVMGKASAGWQEGTVDGWGISGGFCGGATGKSGQLRRRLGSKSRGFGAREKRGYCEARRGGLGSSGYGWPDRCLAVDKPALECYELGTKVAGYKADQRKHKAPRFRIGKTRKKDIIHTNGWREIPQQCRYFPLAS